MIIKGSSIVPGVCYGKIYNTLSLKRKVGSTFLGVEKSIEEYDKVIRSVTKELEDLATKNKTDQLFIDAHTMIVNDPQLRREVVELITKEEIGALDAFVRVIDSYIEQISKSASTYLQERALDFSDVKSRVILHFSKSSLSLKNLHDCILVCDELYPSMLLDMTKDISGIISKKGGYTTHSAIICRSLNIPYVVCPDVDETFKGNVLMNDETIYLNPTADILASHVNALANKEPLSKDLKELKVFANVRSNDEIEGLDSVFSGVGLYRTEFILMDKNVAFDKFVQAKYYENALKQANGRTVTFRTFDCGDDKKIEFMPKATKDVSNYVIYEKLFDIQVEALLEASRNYPNIEIMFPMIETFDQYKEFKKRIVKKARELDVKLPKIGITLETAMAFSHLIDFKNVDFISIGTNDLTQELFNVNRDEVIIFDALLEDLANVCKKVVEFGNEYKIKVSICGEIATNPKFLKKMYDYGLRNVSISQAMINSVYKALN